MVKFDFGVYAQKIRERYSIPFVKSKIYKIEVATQEHTASNEQSQQDMEETRKAPEADSTQTI